MKLRPILDRIVIKIQEPEEQTSGGIVIANVKKEGIVEADVLAVGPGAYNEKSIFVVPDVESGDKILVNVSAGHTLKHNNVEYNIISNDEIVAVLRDK